MTTKLQKYSSYKNSGVKWLGEIPESWKSLSNKYIFKLNKIQVGKKSSEYDLLSLTLNGVIKRDMENPQGKFPAEFDTYQEVKKGDFIFCLFDVEETPRTVGLSDFDGMITGAYTVMQADNSFNKSFLYYFYLNLDADKRMKPLYTGLRNTISKDNFFSFKTFVPPLEEQTAIANFLDDKTNKIDQAIAIKQKQIALLQERKIVIYENAVTKGINSKVKLKPSGVRWLDIIPEHWEIVRSKRLFIQRKERARNTDEQLTASQKHGVIPQKLYMELEARKVTQVEFNSEILKHVEKGDFVISMRSFQGGIEYCGYTGCVSSAYVALIPTKHIEVNYYKYLLKSQRYINELSSTSNLVRDGQALRFDNFSQVDLLIIPIKEQIEIAKYLDSISEKFSNAISLKEKEIEKLKEYKASLINSVVTGKVKVF